MSDDFDFDRDLFDDDDDFGDDDFGDFDDDFGGEIIDDDFGDFGDDDEFGAFDDDEFGARLDFLDDDDDFDEDEFAVVEEESGGNRTFLYAAIAMIIVFVLGLLLILFLVFGGFTNNGEAQATQIAVDASSTAITIENETRIAQIAESATAAVLNVTATREAALGATETAIIDENATSEAGIAASATALVVNITETQAVAIEATDNAVGTATQAIIDEEQQIEDAATETAVSVEQTLNPPDPNVTVDPSLLVTIAPVNPTVDPDAPTVDPDVPTAIPVTLDANGNEVVIIVVDPISLTPIPVTVDANAPTVDPAIPTLIVTPGPSDQLINPDDATSTAEALNVVPTTGSVISLPAVQQTATALAELFLTPTPNAIVPTTDPASVVVTDSDTGDVVVVVTPDDTGLGGTDADALPDTGLFDDVFGGNPLFIILVAFGLLGVIIFSRTVRSVNKEV